MTFAWAKPVLGAIDRYAVKMAWLIAQVNLAALFMAGASRGWDGLAVVGWSYLLMVALLFPGSVVVLLVASAVPGGFERVYFRLRTRP